MCKRRISSANVPYFNDSGISVVSSTLSSFPLRHCEKPPRAKAQRLRSVAETAIKAQLIDWFQAVEKKSGQKHLCFHLLPKKEQKHVAFFW